MGVPRRPALGSPTAFNASSLNGAAMTQRLDWLSLSSQPHSLSPAQRQHPFCASITLHTASNVRCRLPPQAAARSCCPHLYPYVSLILLAISLPASAPNVRRFSPHSAPLPARPARSRRARRHGLAVFHFHPGLCLLGLYPFQCHHPLCAPLVNSHSASLPACAAGCRCGLRRGLAVSLLSGISLASSQTISVLASVPTVGSSCQ